MSLKPKDIKPPIGVVPKFIRDAERLIELKGAIQRYLDAGLTVNLEWIAEYNLLVKIV